MNFSVLPPEINSGRIFSGMGSVPMLAAAAAWDDLANELGSAAFSFSSLTSRLANEAWQGAASAAMADAAALYSGVLHQAAVRAVGAADCVKAVAGAFEAAQAATVHPLLVAANRSALASVIKWNLFGFNAPAIAALESEYLEMWAQNVAAMTRLSQRGVGGGRAAYAVATRAAKAARAQQLGRSQSGHRKHR